jgi:hypothetical protein
LHNKYFSVVVNPLGAEFLTLRDPRIPRWNGRCCCCFLRLLFLLSPLFSNNRKH